MGLLRTVPVNGGLESVGPEMAERNPPNLMAMCCKQGGAKNVIARNPRRVWPRGSRQKDRASPAWIGESFCKYD
ncbi:hypothetical protein [Anaerophaga thermohalophila]|uniref:hypothetical protein n=1 Tax=Anaerophaga thermohalophila TaxID=177400 RepID=UPI000237D34E|nr:hypothetical protein [Anaerophaga thermohalophila]